MLSNMQILTIVIFVLMLMWSLFWKGYASWTAARAGHGWWFVVLLLVNTMGILDIIYLHYVGKKTLADVGKVLGSKIHK